MLTSVDKFGRIIIPKAIREHLGLQAGSVLEIEELDHKILIKIHDDEPKLTREGGFLIFVGKPVGDLENAIEKLREDRFKFLEY